MESLGKNIHQCLEHHFIVFEQNGLVSVASIACVYMYTHARTQTHRERVYVCARACVNTNTLNIYVCIFKWLPFVVFFLFNNGLSVYTRSPRSKIDADR